MARRAEIILICEDSQHGAFARRFLKEKGYKYRNLRELKSPSGRGSAEQWVRERYAEALKTYRTRGVDHIVVVFIDADKFTPFERLQQLDQECAKQGIPARQPHEKLAIFIPSRNIETWLAHLDGKSVNENTNYPRLPSAGECGPHVKELLTRCHRGNLGLNPPSSLVSACQELERIAMGFPHRNPW